MQLSTELGIATPTPFLQLVLWLFVCVREIQNLQQSKVNNGHLDAWSGLPSEIDVQMSVSVQCLCPSDHAPVSMKCIMSEENSLELEQISTENTMCCGTGMPMVCHCFAFLVLKTPPRGNCHLGPHHYFSQLTTGKGDLYVLVLLLFYLLLSLFLPHQLLTSVTELSTSKSVSTLINKSC